MYYIIIRIMNKETKQFRLLFFGYPSNLINYTGGYLWIKKLPNKIINDLYVAIKALGRQPDFAVLDSWGESNIVLWILLRLFKPKTKILVVFHHHEPRIRDSKNILQSLYS